MDNETIVLLIILVLAVGDAIAFFLISRKRRFIDAGTEQGAAKQRVLTFVLRAIHLHTCVMILIVWFVVRPLLSHT